MALGKGLQVTPRPQIVVYPDQGGNFSVFSAQGLDHGTLLDRGWLRCKQASSFPMLAPEFL